MYDDRSWTSASSHDAVACIRDYLSRVNYTIWIKYKILLFEGINKQLRQPGLEGQVPRERRNTLNRVPHLSLQFTEEFTSSLYNKSVG